MPNIAKDFSTFHCEMNPFNIVPGHAQCGVSQCFQRYIVAMQYCDNKTVADVSCGTMYGTSLLSMRAKKVTGVNIDKEAIEFGLRQFAFYCPIETHAIDLNINGYVCENVDVMVSLETMEHLGDMGKFMRSVREHLNPGGIFVFSLPLGPETMYHKHAIKDFREAQEIVKPYFTVNEWYFQNNTTIMQHESYASYWIGICKT